MAFTKRASAFALFLVLALLGDAMASIMMRREAPDTTLSAEGSIATEGDVGTSDDQETDFTNGEETEAAATEDEGGAAGETETEEEGEATGEPEETEEEGGTTEVDYSDEDEGQFPDIGFQTGIVFGSPFVSLRQLQRYFFELERALHRVFENALNEAAQDPNASNNTTTEEITVGGHKYLVNRTVFQGGDEDSSVVIKAISIVPSEERRKRAVMQLV